MKLCRFLASAGRVAFGLCEGSDSIIDLSHRFPTLSAILELDDLPARLDPRNFSHEKKFPLRDVKLLAPVDGQEVWGAGVTYLRSKKARMAESDFSAIAYDLVYQ